MNFRFKKKVNDDNDENESKKKRDNDNGIRILISNYSESMKINQILSFMKTQVEQNTHLILDIIDYFIDEYGVSIIVKNEYQAESIFTLIGTQIGTKHLWISHYPDNYLMKYQNTLSSLFSESLKPNFTMDLSNIKKKINQNKNESNDVFFNEKKKKFDLNDDLCMEFLFLRLGTEAKQNNTIIKHLNLSKNELTHISNLDRLLWFLPGLLEINLTRNPLLAIPEMKGFSHIRLLTDYTKEPKIKEKNQSFGKW